MIVKYKDFLKLYEFYPGSESPYVTIYSCIRKSISLGADINILKFTIKEILNHYKGQESTTKFNRRSDGYKYTSLIMDEIEKSRDDGYPDYLIFNDLEKIYSEMK